MAYYGSVRRGSVCAISVETIRAYQPLVAPIPSPSCRYYPSCFALCRGASRWHGPRRGSGFAYAVAVAPSHPWGGSGYDPVPSEPRR